MRTFYAFNFNFDRYARPRLGWYDFRRSSAFPSVDFFLQGLRRRNHCRCTPNLGRALCHLDNKPFHVLWRRVVRQFRWQIYPARFFFYYNRAVDNLRLADFVFGRPADGAGYLALFYAIPHVRRRAPFFSFLV